MLSEIYLRLVSAKNVTFRLLHLFQLSNNVLKFSVKDVSCIAFIMFVCLQNPGKLKICKTTYF